MSKKKKTIIGAVVGTLVLIAIILIIVFSVGGKKPPPGPSPVDPAFQHYNPYSVEGEITSSESGFSGQLKGHFPASELLLKAPQELHQQVGADPKPQNLGVDVQHIPTGVNNKPLDTIDFKFSMIDFNTAKLEIGQKDAFSIPKSVVNDPEENISMRMEMLDFNINQSPFSFNFTDKQNPDVAWITTKDATLVFAEKYIQMDFTVPSWDLYGFGERVHETKMGQGAWTMWNKDLIPEIDEGYGTGKQSSGMHPFVLFRNPKSNNFAGMFFRNSNNAAPIVVNNATDGTTDISYITTGGKLEVYFFIDGTPEQVIQRYQAVFGKPTLPPFWALGWHQASDAYNQATDIETMVEAYEKAALPLDAAWLSHGAADNGMPFTIDNARFMNIPDYENSITQWKLEYLDVKNVNLVCRTHPGFGINADNNLWRQLTEQEALLKSTINKDNNSFLTADTELAKQANFPDFLQEAAQDIWFQGLDGLAAQVAFNGISIEYDGPYTTCNGECPGAIPTPTPTELLACPVLSAEHQLMFGQFFFKWYTAIGDQSEQSTYKLPFIPGFERGLFDNQTVSLNGTVYEPETKTTHQLYNMRNLYGLQAAQSTYYAHRNQDFLLSGQRPFISSQSTFAASSGQYAAHPSAPVARIYEWLRFSVASVLQMNMFSLPMSGVDVCGTFGEQDDMLCAYWTQLGALLPYARFNYMAKDGANEPFLVEDATAKKLIKNAMNDRMMLSRYMYTEFFETARNGGTFVKPMFFEFPGDEDAYVDLEQDFMVGDGLKVSPVLSKENVKDTLLSYSAYFPTTGGEAWVNVFDFSEKVSTTKDAADATTKTYQRTNITAADHPNVYVKPGAIIPFISSLSYTDSKKVVHTARTMKEVREFLTIDLLVNLNDKSEAKGSLLIDDGESQEMLDQGMYDYYTFQYNKGSLKREWDTNASGLGGLPDSVPSLNRVLNKVVLLNAADKTVDFACVADTQLNTEDMNIAIDQTTGTVTLTPKKGNNALRFYDISTIYFGDSSLDSNLCRVESREWIVHDGAVDLLDKTMVQFILQPLNPQAVPSYDLQVTITLLELIDNKLYNDIKIEVGLYNVAKKDYNPHRPEDVINMNLKQAAMGSLNQRVRIIPGGSSKKGEEVFVLEFFSYTDEKTVIWSTKDHPLFLSKYLLTWGAELMTMSGENFTGAFGLGERVDELMLRDGIYSFWNRDNPDIEENGTLPGKNNYGTHPFIAWQTPNSTFASTFINNAAAQDVVIKNDMTNGVISYNNIAVGGNVEIYFSETRTPDALIEMYHAKIGYPVLVPQWLLGWNQCRYGYKDTAVLEAVVANYTKAGIPLDTMWNDIDYLDNYQDFTVDQKRYSDLGSFVKNTLHKNNQHYIPIIDAGIAYRPEQGYSTYDEGLAMSVFINDFTMKTPVIGKVWPGDSVYPDFTAVNSTKWWGSNLDALEANIAFDGLWLDMNEASNFCNGACYAKQVPEMPVKYNAPYWPAGRDLSIKSIDLDATHANGRNQLEMHNLFAMGEVKATHSWFMEKKKRTAIISRSSFAGQGKFGSRWLGDNFSDIQNMALSVPGIMSMNMFAIPVIGADICGFLGDTNPELCARWYKLGAFYPFARNHNVINAVDQEPYRPMFDVVYKNATVDNTTFSDIILEGIKERYNYIPYLYSHVIKLNQTGGMYFKPLFFEFPNDIMSYKDNQNTFMLGRHLKIAMAVDSLYETNRYFYFPAGSWCPLWKPTEDCITLEEGANQFLRASADVSHVHLRQGAIVPTADAFTNKIMNVHDLRQFPLNLHISPLMNTAGNIGFSANSDSFFVDNGEDFNSYDLSLGTVNEYEFAVSGSSGARFSIFFKHYTKATQYMDKSGCYVTSQNDFLGAIQVHNAKQLQIKSEKLVGVITMQDGSQQNIAAKDLTYSENKKGDKLVLNIAQQFVADSKGQPTTGLICLGLIDRITIAEAFSSVDEPMEAATEVLFE